MLSPLLEEEETRVNFPVGGAYVAAINRMITDDNGIFFLRTLADDPKFFADLSGDANPIHLSNEQAVLISGGLLEGRIMHGVFGVSASLVCARRKMTDEGKDVTVSSIVYRFRSPIYPGAKIKIEIGDLSKDLTTDFAVRVVGALGKPAITGTITWTCATESNTSFDVRILRPIWAWSAYLGYVGRMCQPGTIYVADELRFKRASSSRTEHYLVSAVPVDALDERNQTTIACNMFHGGDFVCEGRCVVLLPSGQRNRIAAAREAQKATA